MNIVTLKIIYISIFCFVLLAIHFLTLSYPYVGLFFFLLVYAILCKAVVSEEEKEKDLVNMLNNEDEIKTLIVKLYARLATLKGDKNDN